MASNCGRNGTCRHMIIHNHSLVHGYKFKQLKSLKLIIPTFIKCYNYYVQVVKNVLWLNELCLDLTEISSEFRECKVTAFKLPDDYNHESETSIATTDEISNYVIFRSPNTRKYTFLANGIGECKQFA